MKPRAVIQLTVLLALVLGAGSLSYWWVTNLGARWSRGAPGQFEGRLESLPTFGRWCAGKEECEPPLSCVYDPRVGESRCLGTECNSDADCAPDQVCRAISARQHAPRLCVVQGNQGEGGRCAEFPLKRHEACQDPLLCNRTFCGRRCQVDSPASCPVAYTCLENGALGPSCVPDCRQHGCPAPRRCFALEERFFVCGVPGSAIDCDAQPCPQGATCRKALAAASDQVYMRCDRPCDAASPCPPGYFCGFGSCLEECDPSLPQSCGPDRKCVRHTRLNRSFCLG